MRIIDPGHAYALRQLDGNAEEFLTFVKREGLGYPGNQGSHPGTNLQEVLRCLIHRLKYLDNQIHCKENWAVIARLRESIRLLEQRAADRHGRQHPRTIKKRTDIENEPVCDFCGHIGCEGRCRG